MGKYVTILLAVFVDVTICQESSMGMFRPSTDVMVASDLVYKERVPYGYTYAKYGRVFGCKITYVSVQDRYGALMGKAPTIQVIRGGLQKTYIALKLTSYNQPIAANVRIGCGNKKKRNKNKVEVVTQLREKDETTTKGSAGDSTTKVGDVTTPAGGVTTQAGKTGDETTQTGEATTAEASASKAPGTETTTTAAAAATTTPAAA